MDEIVGPAIAGLLFASAVTGAVVLVYVLVADAVARTRAWVSGRRTCRAEEQGRQMIADLDLPDTAPRRTP